MMKSSNKILSNRLTIRVVELWHEIQPSSVIATVFGDDSYHVFPCFIHMRGRSHLTEGLL